MTGNENSGDSRGFGKKTTENLMWFTVLPVGTQFFRFANSIILARLLMPRDFGLIGIASIIVYYCNYLTSFGLGNAIVQREEVGKEHIYTFFTFNLILSVFLCLFLIVMAGPVSAFFEIEELKEALRFLSLLFIITSFEIFGYTKLRRELSFRSIAINEVVKVVSSIAISLPLAIWGYGFWALLIAMNGSSAIAAVSINILARQLPKFKFKLQALKDLMNFASWNFVSLQIRMLSEYIDKLIIGKIIGPTQLGFYEKAFGLSQMPNEHIANKIGTVAFSTFSRLQKDNELEYYFARIVTASAFLIFPIYLGLLAISDVFVLVLLGEKWQPMILPFQILLVSFLVTSCGTLFSTLNVTCGFYRKDTKIRFYCLIVLVFIAILVAPLGIEFVALAFLMHNIFFVGLSIRLAQGTFNFFTKNIGISFFPALLGASLMLTILSAAKYFYFYDANLLNLLSLIFLGVGTYIAWFFCTDFNSWHFLKDRSREMFAKIIKRRWF